MRLFSKLFNIRDNTVVERPRSLSGEGIAAKAQNRVAEKISSTPNDTDTVAAPTVDVEALFYSLLFATSHKDTGGIANNLEKRLIGNVESALADPKVIAEKVFKLPHDLIELDKQLANPEVDTDEVIALIKRDPVLSAEVIQLCNAPAFHRGAKDITSLQQAVVILGREQLRRFVSAVKVREVVEIKPIYYRRFGAEVWRHSLQVAYLAAELAKEDQDTAFMLGLIHDVGKIAIFQMLLEAFAKAEPGEQPRSWLFRQVMTSKSLILSAVLARSWQLPPLFSRSLAALANPDNMPTEPLPKAIWTANYISECSMLWQAARLKEAQLNDLLVRIGMDRKTFDPLHDKLILFTR
ncbi:HDOD domain-containing protein [Shewanella sp. FJAT-52076]|uniref:HDOD domain-containing protein n=1 Tax=Shewanella sp. FJAT-52076 TaxID=2864202 RepID=UPI001C65F8F1|nr:HDOD domain-containing protein [Shewanella sp. FJAT-52076]QYJ75448.1 HDOD domain-containing protein [Shewanella sp. FJAT-52076]